MLRKVTLGAIAATLMSTYVIADTRQELSDKVRKKSTFNLFGVDQTPVEIDTEKVRCTSYNRCLLGRGSYEKLLDAQKIAKSKDYQLRVFSGYRSIRYQRWLWNRGAKKYPDPKVRMKWLAYPSITSPHRNGAVDVLLLNKEGKVLTSYLKFKRKNPYWNVLINIMCKAGFKNYIVEPWHFEYGTKRWKKHKNSKKCRVY